MRLYYIQWNSEQMPTPRREWYRTKAQALRAAGAITRLEADRIEREGGGFDLRAYRCELSAESGKSLLLACLNVGAPTELRDWVRDRVEIMHKRIVSVEACQ